MRILFLFLLAIAGTSLHAGDYCLAIRGNGELAPAHWGAIANVVERLGVPEKQAGSSSASITIMLLDAIATGKLVSQASPQEQSIRASLLVKSIEGYGEYLSSSEQFQDFIALFSGAPAAGVRDWIGALVTVLGEAKKKTPREISEFVKENRKTLSKSLKTGWDLGILTARTQPQLFAAFEQMQAGKVTWTPEEVDALFFYAAELVKSLRSFGNFDAFGDPGIFFRQGVIDFERIALQIGRIADFYAHGADTAVDENLWLEFFQTCGKPSLGRTWSELEVEVPQCTSILQEMIDRFSEKSKALAFSSRPVGVTISSFVSTAVLVDGAASESIAGLQDYHHLKSSDFGGDFKISNPEQVKFGYWGSPADLLRMQMKLNGIDRSGDEKNRRFYPLGGGTWGQAISLSAAEPGMSPFVPFTDVQGNEVVSAGGWSDLHPVPILRASGCKKVVYVTRRGGESLFGQGVAKRLLGYERSWDYFETQPGDVYQRNWIRNNIGDSTDMNSLWSRLYNVANPQSSLRVSIGDADAVLCTDWNHFDLKTGFEEMIKDSYRSPYYVRNRTAFAGVSLTPQLNTRDRHPDGYPTFVGCF